MKIFEKPYTSEQIEALRESVETYGTGKIRFSTEIRRLIATVDAKQVELASTKKELEEIRRKELVRKNYLY